MKLFITGAGGQLGSDLLLEAAARSHECVGSDIAHECGLPNAGYLRLDITDREAVLGAIERTKPDAVIHCAAWTDVDRAEAEENAQTVDTVNRLGTRYIAEGAKAVGAKLIYISTEYVFDGGGHEPRRPEDRAFAPLNVYGRSKLAGERETESMTDNFIIVRIAWVFGLRGKNFVRTMLRLGQERSSVRVVDDQIGTPTYTADLARLLIDMAESDRTGYFHATNSEEEPGKFISWADFAEEIFRQAGMNTTVERITTAEYGLSAAARPLNSRLDKSRLTECGFEPLPCWKDALERYLKLLQQK